MRSFFEGLPPISDSQITADLIKKCVSKPDPIILEIGCNDGSTTLWFLQIFDNPRIYCFEPDSRAIGRFNAKIGKRSNVSLSEIALSERNGKIAFHTSGGQLYEQHKIEMPEGWDMSGSIRKPKEHLKVYPWVTFNRTISVDTSTLDTWCDKNGIGTIDFIWMDVQGAEIDVFKGAKRALARTRFLYTEYNNQELYVGQINLKKILRCLKDFKVLVRYPDDVLLSRKKEQDSIG
jgi:2-O-methyltransferase